MTAITTPAAPTPPASETRPAPRRSASGRLWKTGMGAGVVASVATFAVAAAASGLGVPIEIGGKAIPLAGFSQLTFVGALIGTILAVVLSRRATRPRRTFLVTTIALTALSIVPDVLADAHTATRFTLALTHIVAAAIVIPALASRMTD